MDIHYNLNGESFVWDADKAERNISKHGVHFENAATVFFDPLFVLIDASRNDEVRDAVVGHDANGHLLFVVHIEHDGEHIRIISARPASRTEEKHYAQ